jgi:hypothetical protein
VGDNGSTGGVGGAVETGVSRNLASERVSGDGGDGHTDTKLFITVRFTRP